MLYKCQKYRSVFTFHIESQHDFFSEDAGADERGDIYLFSHMANKITKYETQRDS